MKQVTKWAAGVSLFVVAAVVLTTSATQGAGMATSGEDLPVMRRLWAYIEP